MSNTLALFWDITSTERDARLNASQELVQTLISSQPSSEDACMDDVVANTAHASSAEDVNMSEEEVEASEQRIDELNTSEVSYAIRRLVRGLASPRENARIGFAVALSELLSHLSTVSAHDILALLWKHSVVRGNLSGQEVRDLHFARLFGVYTLARSRLLYSRRSSLVTFKRTFLVIIAVASYKSWLSESCGWVLVELIRPLRPTNSTRPPWADDALSWVFDQLQSLPSFSPETLALLLTLMQTMPSLSMASHRMIPPFKQANPLAPANLPALASILREATPMHWNSDTPAPKAGTWTAHLPFVWDMVLDLYLGKPHDKNLQGDHDLDDMSSEHQALLKGAAPFPDFFRVVVDESLFATQASPERKSWGFQVLHRTLPRASADVLPFLFTPNLMRTWVNQLSVPDRLLHSMAQKTVLLVGDAVRRCPTAGIALVTQLTGEHGRQNFDRVTHTKTIESILSSLDEAGLQRYLAYLRSILYASGMSSDDVKSIAMRRQSACDQMLALVRSRLVKSSGAWVRDVLLFFAGHGYYAVKKNPARPWSAVLQVPDAGAFSNALRNVCRSRLQACLVELHEPDEHGKPWPLVVMDMLDRMEEDSEHFSCLANAVAQERIRRGREVLKQVQRVALKEKNERQLEKLHAFEVLLASVILVTFEDSGDAPDMIDPLVDTAQLLFLDKPKKQKQKHLPKTQDAPQHEVGGMELLTDTLVGLLEFSSAFLRSMVGQVFAKFSRSMTKESLDHLIDQLGMNEPEKDDDVGHEHEEGMEEDEEVDEEDEEDEEEEEDDEEELEEEDEADDDVDPVLRSRVEEAFRASGLADDNDDDNNASNNEEDDVAVLDDDQMAKLDDKLAEIFQQHTSSKRKEREALQRDTALFHNKILDLLDMYAKEQSGNALVLRLIAPLLALARGSGDVSQQVATRASQILRQRLCKSKELPRGEIDVDELVRELSATHELARTSHDATMADLAAAVSHLYTKVLVRHLQIDGPVTVFKHTLQDFLERKSSPVRPAFIIEAIRRYPELGWGLRHALLDGCHMSKAARAFRQVQAYTMLQAVLQQQQHPDTRQASVQDVLSFIAQVRHVVGETVMAAASSAENDDSATSLNAQRLKDVLRFALQGVRMTVRISDGQATSVQACWPPDELEAILQALQSSERFKSSSSLHSIMKEMLSLIRRSDPSPSSSGLPTKQKRRASENGGENSENSKRRASSGPTKIRSTDTST